MVKLQAESRFGQELVVMDQAVAPTIPFVLPSQVNILESKVASSVLHML